MSAISNPRNTTCSSFWIWPGTRFRSKTAGIRNNTYSIGQLRFLEKNRAERYNRYCGNIINWHLNGGQSLWDGARQNLQPRQAIRSTIIFTSEMKRKSGLTGITLWKQK